MTSFSFLKDKNMSICVKYGRITLLALIVISASNAGCQIHKAPSLLNGSARYKSIDDKPEYTESVGSYVQASRGWSEDNYKIEFGGRYDENILIYEIIYIEYSQQSALPKRDERSFGIYFDIAKRKVVKEFGLQ